MQDGQPAKIMPCPKCGRVCLIVLEDKICMPCRWKENKDGSNNSS